MNKEVKLTTEEVKSLQDINTRKFDAYQQITAITSQTNQNDIQWWEGIYKNHNLDPKAKFEIKGTSEGVFLTEIK